MNRFFIEIYLKFPFGLAELQFLVISIHRLCHTGCGIKIFKTIENHSVFFYICCLNSKDIS